MITSEIETVTSFKKEENIIYKAIGESENFPVATVTQRGSIICAPFLFNFMALPYENTRFHVEKRKDEEDVWLLKMEFMLNSTDDQVMTKIGLGVVYKRNLKAALQWVHSVNEFIKKKWRKNDS